MQERNGSKLHDVTRPVADGAVIMRRRRRVTTQRLHSQTRHDLIHNFILDTLPPDFLLFSCACKPVNLRSQSPVSCLPSESYHKPSPQACRLLPSLLRRYRYLHYQYLDAVISERSHTSTTLARILQLLLYRLAGYLFGSTTTSSLTPSITLHQPQPLHRNYEHAF
jgi:hypothetical protein